MYYGRYLHDCSDWLDGSYWMPDVHLVFSSAGQNCIGLFFIYFCADNFISFIFTR